MTSVRYSPIRVARVLVVHENQVVLVKSAKTNAWELPGGQCQPGERYVEAAARELYEETGVVGTLSLQYVLFHRVTWGVKEVRHMTHYHLLKLAAISPLCITDTKEIKKAVWCNYKKLPKRMSAESAKIISAYINNVKKNSKINIFTDLS